MSGCIVGEVALVDELVFLLDRPSQADGTDINTLEQLPCHDDGSLAH
jgi:hypothetical protein